MGKTLATLFGMTSKLTSLLRDSITRTTFLRNRHHSLLLFSTSDVVELLKLAQNKQALLRVEHVIKSRNMVETISTVEFYCHLLVKGASQIERNKDCPEEFKEAISSLIYASSRIGEFPELVHIRDYFASRFGKDFVSQITEFPLYSDVNAKLVQNLSTRKPSLETRVSYLREIASENGITLHLDVDSRQETEKGKPTKLSRNTLTINQVLTSSG
ncbi:uncharacterized protein LOC141604619 [Silene latifolia]|uniref:uncharacterized protein LOC141604619 n=1 Tax=Silene latifolia TaxID=37657 RepID=UPI003D777D7F